MSEPTPITELDHHDQIALRKQKLATLRKQGSAYPTATKPSIDSTTLATKYEKESSETLAEQKNSVAMNGRIMTCRQMGKASFVHIQDNTGTTQLYLRQQTLGEDVYEQFKTWDLGDCIHITGYVFRTKVGELSVHCDHIQLEAKALHPLPDKFHGLADQEIKYRQRYLDLISNKETRTLFQQRSHIIQEIRQCLLDADFLEVETPMLHPIPGGAIAKPFVTHHNALDRDLFLRIAPELYLKKLVVGGLHRVFEINRNFRNEGLSTRHNPEFTELEFYQAHATYETLMDFTETMLRQVSKKVLGTTEIKYRGQPIDLGKPFARISMYEAVQKKFASWPKTVWQDREALAKKIKQEGFKPNDDWGIGGLMVHLFEETIESELIQPTFITGYPTEVSPLARRNDTNPELTDRFEMFLGGFEVANGFSELNDPEDQAQRFQEQADARASGDDEAMYFDQDYITALEHGMPPTAGEGIGIDRLVMVLTGATSIRDVILFPSLRDK
jgi:lysyl-tRNA synthetase, class II